MSDAFGREAKDDEVKSAEKFMETQSAEIARSEPPDEKQLPIPATATLDRAKAAAVVDFCHALLCSNEFLMWISRAIAELNRQGRQVDVKTRRTKIRIACVSSCFLGVLAVDCHE